MAAGMTEIGVSDGARLEEPEAVRVACILVNWRNAVDTIACLRALDAQDAEGGLAVFVVDNGSGDGSVEQIRGYMASRPGAPEIPDGPGLQRSRFLRSVSMTLVEAGENRGFSAGNNVGIRAASRLHPEFVWLLNNDTEPPPDTLRKLLQKAEVEREAGAVGAVLRYAHDPGRVQAWGGGHVSASTAYTTHFTAPHVFGSEDYLTFASVLLRSSMLGEIGLMDENFFLYYEDVEFCLRAQRAGWRFTVAEDTAILHKEGGSTGGGRAPVLERAITSSGLRLIRMYGRYPRLGEAFFVAARVGKRLLRLRLRAAAATMGGAMEFWRSDGPR